MEAVRILVDADACPVKEEACRVASRHGVPIAYIANSWMRLPDDPLVERVIVSDGFDAADDAIVARSAPGVVVVTADILLADRCLKAGAQVVAPTGKPFTPNSIGAAIATRAIMADLRAGVGTGNVGGPAPFANTDRSRFLSALHDTVERLKRA